MCIIIVTGFWKTYHLHTRDKQNNYKYFKQPDISVKDIYIELPE